ncbi:MAG TPA: formimidoylglutamate deiminase, partial [Jatrophihabitans sp.]|nr:formimidoylglutamate deiminase [Jatrophihabitans sp.]
MTEPGGKAYFAEQALLPGGPARDVRLEVADGRFTAVTPGATADGAERLPGVVLPGFANCHSHAFHRALRGRTHAGGGSFWTWRQAMYALAGRLDPDRYHALARGAYAEMALAGFTTVAEFHYLHHAAGGRPYADPNAMAAALRAAAAEAGVRLTLLDACYLAGGLDGSGPQPLDGVQRRFADPSAEAWAVRVAELRPDATTRVGVAVHSVRAVPRADLAVVAAAAGDRPLHVHLSEQPAENVACQEYYRMTPTQLLAAEGVLGPSTTAVHATHPLGDDIARLAAAGTAVCLCPITERDLADGIGPAAGFADAGIRLSLGTDQHAQTDPFEEARAVELHERLQSHRRGRFAPADLLRMLTRHETVGWPDAGRLEPGARADAVAVRLDTPRTAGAAPEQVLFAATPADVDTVLVDGRVVVAGGAHRLGDVGRLLGEGIEAAWH